MNQHGRPDYYDVSPLVQVHASDDLAEHVARTTNINVYDRRGNVIQTEDFADGSWYGMVSAGAPAAYYLSCAASRSEGISLKASLNGPAGYQVTMLLSQGVQSAGSMGLEICYSLSAAHGSIQIALYQYLAATAFMGSLKLDFDAHSAYIYNSAASWQLITDDFYPRANSWSWHFAKLAVDFTDTIYLRAMMDNVVISLTSENLRAVSVPGVDYVQQHVVMDGGGGIASDMYLDHVIVTINEL